jgi:hypothetical protein
MRSCSSSVLAHESAEQVAPVDLGRRIFATEGRFDSGIRRLQPEGPVWAMGVVVLDVDPQHLIKQARQLDELGRAGSYASTRALASRNSSSESPRLVQPREPFPLDDGVGLRPWEHC